MLLKKIIQYFALIIAQSYNHSLVLAALEMLAASGNLIKSPIKFTWEEDLQALEGWEKSGFKVSLIFLC